MAGNLFREETHRHVAHDTGGRGAKELQAKENPQLQAATRGWQKARKESSPQL